MSVVVTKTNNLYRISNFNVYKFNRVVQHQTKAILKLALELNSVLKYKTPTKWPCSRIL